MIIPLYDLLGHDLLHIFEFLGHFEILLMGFGFDAPHDALRYIIYNTLRHNCQ